MHHRMCNIFNDLLIIRKRNLLFWLRERKNLVLAGGLSLELTILAVATLVTFLLFFMQEVALYVSGVLIALYLFYLWVSSRAKVGEPELMGPSAIIGGLALGVRRAAIVEFSFLLAVPTMLAATGWDLLKSAPMFSSDQLHLLIIGGTTSFLVALASIRWLLRYIQRHDFAAFGVYRILAALVFWVVV